MKLWGLLGIAAVLVVMTWVAVEMLDLERAETHAHAEARYQQNLRLALSRLDRAFARLLEREASRPPGVYDAFYYVEAGKNWNRKDLMRADIVTQSPLLDERPDYIRLHFQVDGHGEFTSPQLPATSYLAICEIPAETIAQDQRTLERVRGLVDASAFLPKVQKKEAQTVESQQTDSGAQQASIDVQQLGVQRRQQVANIAKGGGQTDSKVGTLEPFWVNGELLFLRRVTEGEAQVLQGFLVDWTKLRVDLATEYEDLFPHAMLRPAADDDTADERLLSLPVVLQAPRPRVESGGWTATHTVLLVTCLVVLTAIAGAWYALKKSTEFGESQRRFASNVTHELRSPLTTFRLYSDLLAEGLTTDPEKTHDYHRTMQRESARMSRMVENVIAHARIEEGRAQLHRRTLLVQNLLDEAAPDLEAAATKAGMELTLEAGAAAEVALDTDPSAVAQILQNLVENACKYGGAPIHVGASVNQGTLLLAVRDHGAGVTPDVARRIFNPFERGGRDEIDPVRGLGLGLTLSRGLARDLGGDLTLESPTDGGARFVLSLPV